jgi:hypothetical protein
LCTTIFYAASFGIPLLAFVAFVAKSPVHLLY